MFPFSRQESHFLVWCLNVRAKDNVHMPCLAYDEYFNLVPDMWDPDEEIDVIDSACGKLLAPFVASEPLTSKEFLCISVALDYVVENFDLSQSDCDTLDLYVRMAQLVKENVPPDAYKPRRLSLEP